MNKITGADIDNIGLHDFAHEMWWRVDLNNGTHSASESLIKICGSNAGSFTLDDLLHSVHPDHINEVRLRYLRFRDSSNFEYRFQLLTKQGYRWVYSCIDQITTDPNGSEIALGHIEFLSDRETILAQSLDAQTRINELTKRYTSISTILMELLNSSGVSSAIKKILNSLLNELHGDRTYIFKYDLEAQTQSCVYEAVRDSITPESESLQNIPLSATAWWTEMLLHKNKPIICNTIEELLPNATNEYELLKAQNIESLMVVPLISKGGVSGYLGVDMVGQKHNWSETDQQWFNSLANMISLCIELKISEEKAQKEKAHSSRLYENMPIGFLRLQLLYDQDGRPVDYLHLEINPTAYTFSGIDADAVGKLGSQIDKELMQEKLDKFDELIKTRGTYKDRIISETGCRFFDYTIYSVDNDELIILIQDNTESIIASRALRKSEQTLQNIYKNIPVGIEIYDKNGILLSVNDMEQEIFGFASKEDVLGVNLFKNPNVPQSFLDDLRNGKPSRCDFYYDFEGLNNYYTSKCNGKKHIILRGTILYDTNHNIENYLLMVIDNTDTLRATHKIHEFEILFNSIAEFSDVGLCQWNPIENTIFGTDQWHENLCQAPRKISNIMDAYSNVHEDDQVKVKQGFDDILSGKITSFREELRIMNGGELKWLRSNYKASGRSDKDFEIIGINIDITELKNTEIKLTEAKIQAEESDRLKSAFLANMSHEIRTPLNAIVGFSDLLADAENGEDRKQYISIIRKNNDLLLQLISDILDISKIESGLIDIRPEPVNINELCSEVVHAQSMKISKDVSLTFKPELSECFAITDKNRIVQVLSNLIGNAIKFTNIGYIDVGCQLKGDHLLFHVKDSGIGIAKSQLESIFTRFIKLNSFIAGTGLGLSICKSIIEKLDGKIWVESTLGEGTCFWFTIPYDKDILGLPQQINQLSPVEPNLDYQPLQTENKPLILVAEDTDSNYLLVATILKKEYTVIRAYDGVEAIKLFKSENPDLILMDMKMPNMGGIEASKNIKAINPDMPIIVLTAFAYDNDKSLAVEAGCEFMTKPVNPSELKEMVRKHVK